jgi:prepilin-type N-terminal cleavage/methylation domain-containing protein
MGPIARGRLSRRARTRVAAESGFTIIELLIAMVILLIIMVSLTSVLVTASHTEIDLNKRFQAQQNDRIGLDHLRRDIHCASAVTQTDGTTPLVAGTTYGAITVTLPAQCPTASVDGSGNRVTTYVTWCTSGSALTTGDFALYRIATTTLPPAPAACTSAGKVKWSDYLAYATPPGATPFCLPSTSTSCGTPAVLKPTSSLPLLHVSLPVNLNGPPPTYTREAYNLVDDIALKNGARS